MNTQKEILKIKNLSTHFKTDDGVVRALNGINLTIRNGETLGLVGESGSGKSVTALSVMRLIASPPGRIVEGGIMFDGKDLARLSESDMRYIRGDRISMIFQEPMTSLNPVIRIGVQVAESLQLHKKMSKAQAAKKAVEMLNTVGIPDAEKRALNYPHQMSGGMRQRVMIAMALSCKPELLIADEPTTALDVTIQAQIIYLMNKLKEESGTSILLITHDMGVIAEMCDNVAVMYAGQIVEYTDVNTLFEEQLHPYTEGLLAAIPVLGEVRESLAVIPGSVPNLINLPPGCKFAPRCPYVKDMCVQSVPTLVEVVPGHKVRCFMRLPETKAEWGEVQRADWHFFGDEVMAAA